MMTHILYGKAEAFATSDPDWYGVAAQVGKHVNKRSARTDITAVVSTTAGHGAPACFVPSLAEMHLNTSVLDLGRADKVDLTDNLWMLEHAAAVGACDHEAAHARHTRFDPRELIEIFGATRKMVDVITTLEEPRIEGKALRDYPGSLPFLRATAMEIVGRDFTIPGTPYGAAAAAALLLARVDAGVLTRTEARPFRKAITGVLGDDVLAALEPLWQRFLRLADWDNAGMVAVAREWLEALGEDPEDASGMVGEAMMGEPLPGDPEAGEGEGEGEASDFGESIKAKARAAEVKMDGEVVEARADERDERKAAEARADRERKAAGEPEHAKAFPKSHGFSPDGFAHLSERRAPTADERRAARSLAAALEKIDFRDKAVAKVTSAVPPGRLRGRAAVQADAARSQGREPEVGLWAAKRRVRTESTPLTIGFAVDISGSMGAAMQPLASTQWVVSTAGAHIDAKVSSVHFGYTVHGVTPAGVRESDVRVFAPRDGSEAFRGAALALDRELDLLDGRGARLMFVASDGEFVSPPDKAYAKTFMPLAARKGVAVMFLNFDRPGDCKSFGAPIIECHGLSPVAVAEVIGRVATAEMRRLDRRV